MRLNRKDKLDKPNKPDKLDKPDEPDKPDHGPLRTLAGSIMMLLTSWRTPLTVIPINLKGMRRSQTIGYKNKARIARGQHKTKRSSQSKNFPIDLFLTLNPKNPF